MGRWDPTGLGTLDDFAYQQRTNNSILQQAAEQLASIGECVISYSQLLDRNDTSITERFADGLTSAEGLAVLQDTTRTYVTSMSKQELVESLNSAKLVTGMDMTEVSKAIEQLNKTGFDISFDPTGCAAFSFAGYVFTPDSISSIATSTTSKSSTYYKIKGEDDVQLFCHEDGHYQAALATGNVGKWFLYYNNEYMKNLADGMDPVKAYYSLKDEREMYSFGPFSNTTAANFANGQVKY